MPESTDSGIRPEQKEKAQAPSGGPDKEEVKRQIQPKAPADHGDQKKGKVEPPEQKKETKPVMKPSSQKPAKAPAVIYKGSGDAKRVALTFDDGPDRHFTLQILEILEKERVPATFFVVGQLAEKHPDILREIDRRGHVIGNHSFSHPVMTRLSSASATRQVEETNRIIRDATGKSPRLFRPPYGAVNKPLIRQVSDQGFHIIQWSVDTRDWAGPSSKKIVHTVKQQVGPGGIILQHSAGGPQLKETVKALPVIIRHLKQEGYEFVTVDQLIGIPAYH
ncbi:polysaccharide deacetylase family protein [Staphylospora marina]|uniref:polysaccharide deacetylase family protein n=1 Tax=Staphylospora marina TaxID=2490858 RepID=UPI001F1521E3|nr:polysaccharide deacetylase family protein [Staphylospora marina]